MDENRLAEIEKLLERRDLEAHDVKNQNCELCGLLTAAALELLAEAKRLQEEIDDRDSKAEDRRFD